MVSARFCGSTLSDCEAGTGRTRIHALWAPPKQANRSGAWPSPAVPPGNGISQDYFSFRYLSQNLRHWARLGHVKLSLGYRKQAKRKRKGLGGQGPRKPRFARAPHPLVQHHELVQSRAEAEAAIIEAR